MELLTQIYEKRGDADSAVLPAKDSFYFSLLSTVHFGSGKFELARFSLLQALRLAQQENRGAGVEGALLHNLAVSSLLLRDFAAAQAWQKKALFLLPRNPVCWLRFAEICWQRARSGREPREWGAALGEVVWRGNPFALMNGAMGADWRPDGAGEALPRGQPWGEPWGETAGIAQSGAQRGNGSKEKAKNGSSLGTAQTDSQKGNAQKGNAQLGNAQLGNAQSVSAQIGGAKDIPKSGPKGVSPSTASQQMGSAQPSRSQQMGSAQTSDRALLQ